ncbi:MAG: NosD domain-containing protein [Gemmatimonadota bacterium]
MSLRSFGSLALLAAVALAASCAHVPPEERGAGQAGPRGLAATEMARDATWSGDVRVDGVVHVRKGATLTILPGTRVAFAPGLRAAADEHEGFAGSGIRVEGRIVAEGTQDGPIVFTAAGTPPNGPPGASPAPGTWDKILFSFSAGSRFDNCVFEGARYAFHAHFSEISVLRCIFRDNEEGVRLGQSRVTIVDSVFTRNEVRGINFRECRNEIRGNLVYGNGDGIFLHSKDSASVIRGNAIYGNRGFDLRLGDLHADDIDASGNWWGTPREDEARRKVFDGRNLPGVGAVRLSPVLARPPVAGAQIRGVFVSHMTPVEGAQVRAFTSVAAGLWTDADVARATTGADGQFALSVPPGRYFVVGRAESSAGSLFAFPGKNPVTAALGETAEIGLPSVLAPPRAVATAAGRSSIAVRTTVDGSPAAGVTVQAQRPGTPDFRGPGEASAVTNEAGAAALFLPPGKYLLAAKKRATGAALGMVDEGGLFGVYPYSPVELPTGTTVTVEIPLFEKRGWLGTDDERTGAGPGTEVPDGAARVGGTATRAGRPAAGYIVFFYRSPETIGRPAARSSVVSSSGEFEAALPGPGEYLAYLRRSVPGVPGGAEEERIGPIPVRVEEGRFAPAVLAFDGKRGGAAPE